MKPTRKIIPVFLFLILFFAGVFVMQYLQSSLQNTTMILGVDLYPRWVGAQAVLEGESPYSQSTRQQIWLEIYGSTETPDGNLFGFYYPPAITTLLMPFILSGISADFAAVLWCALLFAILSFALILWIMYLREQYKGFIILPVLLVSGWLFRPAFSNYLLGQSALLCVFAAITAWVCYEKDHPVWAGVFATFALVKPSLTIIPIGLLILQNWRKPNGLFSLAASSLLLYLPPTILLGWWLPDFFSDISNYTLENRVAWSAMDIITIPGITWILISMCLIGLGIKEKIPLLVFGAAFALNAVITPHSADYDLVAFIPLLVYIGNHWIVAGNRRWLFTPLFFALIWLPWLSLIAILQTIDANAVEAWYRFIWLIYPPIILIFGLFVFVRQSVKVKI